MAKYKNNRKLKVNHYISQNFIFLGILLISFLILWNYLEFFNMYVLLFIRLGSVLLILNVYFLAKQLIKVGKIVKRSYYDKFNWFKYATFGLFTLIILIVFLLLPSPNELKNNSTEQLVNLSPFNPLYLGENTSSVSDLIADINFTSFESNESVFYKDDCTKLVEEAITQYEIKSRIDVNGNILSSEIFTKHKDAINYANKYVSSKFYGNRFCENNLTEIKTYVIQFDTLSGNAMAYDKVTSARFCGNVNGNYKLIQVKSFCSIY